MTVTNCHEIVLGRLSVNNDFKIVWLTKYDFRRLEIKHLSPIDYLCGTVVRKDLHKICCIPLKESLRMAY